MIQLQPKYIQRNDWKKLADREGFGFEILELTSTYLNREIPKEVINWYRDTGLTHSIHGAFMDNFPISPDMQIRALSRITCEKSCQLAKEIGAKNVVYHSTALPFLRGPVMLSWCQEAAEYYQELAQKYDLHIYMENFSDLDYEPLARMMDYVTDPRVQVCLDIGHANYSRASVSEWIQALSDRIGYLHLSDNGGLWDDHVVLGTGTIDFSVVQSWWSRQSREIPVTLEVPSLEGTVQSIEYLKKQGFFGYSL